MKKLLLSALILVGVIFVFAVNVPAASLATPEGDFIDMYKEFFRDMQATRHEKVWDALALPSKKLIAKTLNDAAISMKKQSTQASALDMLNKNISNVRADYFIKLNGEFQAISFYKHVLEGQYSVKSMAKDRIVITISMKNEPKDFQILLEDGRWKIDFFSDMMR
jgi:hypothetical protein